MIFLQHRKKYIYIYTLQTYLYKDLPMATEASNEAAKILNIMFAIS